MKQKYARVLESDERMRALEVFSNGRKWTSKLTKPKMFNITDANREQNNKSATAIPAYPGSL